MNLEKLKQEWIAEEKFSFKGWDFSHINDRYDEGCIPWDYNEIVTVYLKSTDELLDMGTGGGEFLLCLNHPYNLLSVTEAYEPNVKLCKQRLSPLGITVKQIFEDEKIPYGTDSFDIAINRHESFDPNEVTRILKSDKYFITQQVGSANNADISQRLLGEYKPLYSENTLKNNIKLLKNVGFEIEFADEAFVPTRFYDVGAFVYFAKIIEWEFQGFSVEKHLDKLIEFQKEIEKTGYIEATEHRFIIVAKNK